jgi:hypothetical protein
MTHTSKFTPTYYVNFSNVPAFAWCQRGPTENGQALFYMAAPRFADVLEQISDAYGEYWCNKTERYENEISWCIERRALGTKNRTGTLLARVTKYGTWTTKNLPA